MASLVEAAFGENIGLTGMVLQSALQDEVECRLKRGWPEPFPVNPQIPAVVAGRNQDFVDVILMIDVDGRRLVVQSPNQRENEPYARSENHHSLRGSDAGFKFNRIAGIKVDGAVMA